MYSYNWAYRVVSSFYKAHARAAYFVSTFPEQTLQVWATWVQRRDPRWEGLKRLIKMVEVLPTNSEKPGSQASKRVDCAKLIHMCQNDTGVGQFDQLTGPYFRRILDLQFGQLPAGGSDLREERLKQTSLPGQFEFDYMGGVM